VKDNHWYIIKDDIDRVPLHNEKLVIRRKQCLLVMINLLIKDENYFLNFKDEQFEGSFKEVGESHCTTNTG
jgi:mRNA-degrading endonuclease YafQ of YafQ-DinJ toxin-antitoxin module